MSIYIIPTPIGNLGDITLRAIEILKKVDLILAEDTRKSSKLLQHYQIEVPLNSYHNFNEHRLVEKISTKIQNGQQVALITDAGTPGISDPGYLLIRACLEKGVKVEALPGATALIPALVKSGIPMDKFVFEGFLPHKKGRKTRIQKLSEEERTVILYESPHRILKTLEQCIEHFGEDRKASVSRELTKIYEETVNGSLGEILNHFSNKQIKGEFVIVIAGK